MHILVINSGSSSIKFSIFAGDDNTAQPLYEGEASGLGTDQPELRFLDAAGHDCTGGKKLAPGNGEADASHAIADLVMQTALPQLDALGFRVVHPGADVTDHARITPKLLDELRRAAEFAPLHEPVTIRLIEMMEGRFPKIPQYACFDTVFHETMPEEAKTYALPDAVRARGVRRYGFHGLSCESIVAQMRDAEGKAELVFPQRMIVAHLGSGCSVTAIAEGKSVDTTMGLTPDGGVVMGTRPGDLDPGVVLYLLRQEAGDRAAAISAVEKMLNQDAGTHALSGLPNDVRRMRSAAAEGDARAKLALAVFTRSIKKAIGGYIALLRGTDAIVFTGGIGEHDALSRGEILHGLEALGVKLDTDRNRAQGAGLRRLSTASEGVAVYAATAEEDKVIARHVLTMSRDRL